MRPNGQTTETKRAEINPADPSSCDTLDDNSGQDQHKHGCPECSTKDLFAVGYQLLRCGECGQETTVTDTSTTGPLKQPTQAGASERNHHDRTVRTTGAVPPSRYFFSEWSTRPGSVPVRPPTGTLPHQTARRNRLTTPATANTTASCSSTTSTSSVVLSCGWPQSEATALVARSVWPQSEAKLENAGVVR